MNSFDYCEKKITESDLVEFEKKYGFAIPKDLREHYLMYNGGTPKKAVFIKDDTEYEVNYFYSIKYGESMLLEKVMDLLDNDIFPKWLVPIADDLGGNIFAYSIRDYDYGHIFYYSHEFDYGKNPEDNIVLLSDSFTHFYNSLIEGDF